MNKFIQWVEKSGGVPRLAVLLGVTPHAVRVWVRGHGTPRASMIAKIIRLSKNKLSFEDIVSVKRQVTVKTRVSQ